MITQLSAAAPYPLASDFTLSQNESHCWPVIPTTLAVSFEMAQEGGKGQAVKMVTTGADGPVEQNFEMPDQSTSLQTRNDKKRILANPEDFLLAQNPSLVHTEGNEPLVIKRQNLWLCFC